MAEECCFLWKDLPIKIRTIGNMVKVTSDGWMDGWIMIGKID